MSKPLLSLIIPIYNEELHLKAFLEKIDRLDLPCDKELVIVDDFSEDKSQEIVENFAFTSKFQYFKQPRNKGKGAALQLGIKHAKGEFIGIQDADFEYDTADVVKLLPPLMEDQADVVYGSRFKKSNVQVHRTFHYLVNRFLTLLSNMFSGVYLTDMETCYKFFKAEIIQNINLESNRFGFEPEITAKIARLKVRIVEVPISYFPRSYIEGKKITYKDGFAALRHVVYFNMFQKVETFFRDDMPARYLAKNRQWL